MSKVYDELRSSTLAGVNPKWSKRKRMLYTPIVSHTIARSGSPLPRNEMAYYTVEKFVALAQRYAWSKLNGIAELRAQRPVKYREKIYQLDSNGNVVTNAKGYPLMKVVSRTARFDTNLIDDCVQQSWFYWQMLGYEPHAAMFFGTRHYITATLRLKVTGDSAKAIDLAPSVSKYEDKLTLKTSDEGELALLELSNAMPNLIQLVFTELDKSKLKTSNRTKNRQPSPRTVREATENERNSLIRKLKHWFRESPTAAEQAAMDERKEFRKEWNDSIRQDKRTRSQRFNDAIASLAFGPPTYDDYLVIFNRRHALRHANIANRSWLAGDAGMYNGFTGPTIARNKRGELQGYSPEGLRELRILKPRLCLTTEETIMYDGTGI